MTLAWPWALLGLLALPLVVVAYRRLLRQQAERRADLARQGLVVPAPRRDRWRHVAPVLLVAALAVMLLALTTTGGRRRGAPSRGDRHPRLRRVDVHGGEGHAADPSRRGQGGGARVRREAAVDGEDRRRRLRRERDHRATADHRQGPGARVVQPPGTPGRDVLGRGILTSLSAIAGKPILSSGDTEQGGGGETPIGYYGGTAIVLLTDGENTSGPEPADLADLASAAGVKIYSIGLGSASGTVLEVDGFSVATHLDEDTLKEIAEVSGGTYYNATDATSLAQVYDSIQLNWVSRSVPHEVTSLVAGVADPAPARRSGRLRAASRAG